MENTACRECDAKPPLYRWNTVHDRELSGENGFWQEVRNGETLCGMRLTVRGLTISSTVYARLLDHEMKCRLSEEVERAVFCLGRDGHIHDSDGNPVYPKAAGEAAPQ